MVLRHLVDLQSLPQKWLHHSISYVNVKLLNSQHVTRNMIIIIMNSISLNESMGFESFHPAVSVL